MPHIVRKHPTLVARSYPRLVLAAFVAGTLLVHASVTHAAGTPEQKCQNGRYAAAAKYGACEQKAIGIDLGGGDFAKFGPALAKCIVKYSGTWAKLQAKASGSGDTCDHTRFRDNGDGTVTDLLTALQWEKKDNLDGTQNLSDPHDADNEYAWSTTGYVADGTAFTSFLAALNAGGCFAGQCDWRLPTIYELQTILDPSCATNPCIDPVFGPTDANDYWSATTNVLNLLTSWEVDFNNAIVGGFGNVGSLQVRAVRAGL